VARLWPTARSIRQAVAVSHQDLLRRSEGILLVFLLSSIGGMIGNFIAIPWITALLRGGK
jgi:hypothetical protein